MTELKSNTEWKQWGREDPLWGVASWASKEKGGASPWTDEEFYALGSSDWEDCLVHWRQYGLNTQSCLEIGCGAGRITKHIAATFERVCAVDVSEQMIDCARKAIDSGNVEFSVIDGLHLPQSDQSVKAIFSTHVVQHLDSVDIGFSYFREFFRVLDKGGTIMIHLPVYEFPSDGGQSRMLMHFIYSLSRRFSVLRADLRRRTGRKTMRGTPYPMQSLRVFLSELGFKNIELRVFALKSNGAPHPFIFATK